MLYHMGLSENGSPTIAIKNEKKRYTRGFTKVSDFPYIYIYIHIYIQYIHIYVNIFTHGFTIVSDRRL